MSCYHIRGLELRGTVPRIQPHLTYALIAEELIRSSGRLGSCV